jgi:ABC-type sugar transport system substrate-binding protein
MTSSAPCATSSSARSKLFFIAWLLFIYAHTFHAALAQQRQPHYVALIKATTFEYWKVIEDGFKQVKRDQGVNLTIVATATLDAQEQLALCESLELKKPDAYIVASITPVNLYPCLAQASARGALIIDLDGNINFDDAQRRGIAVPFGVASSNYEIGLSAGEYARRFKGKALVLEGVPGALPSEDRVRGFKEAASHLSIIASLPADWESQKAFATTADVLSAHPDLNLIYAANDPMALGAYEAAKAAGRKDVVIIGTDGMAAAVTSIRRGEITASIAQLPFLMSEVAVTKASGWLERGERFAGNHKVPILVLDKESLSRNDQPLYKYLR